MYAWRHGTLHETLIDVRFDGLTATGEAAAMRSLIDRQSAAMRAGAIIVVTGRRGRIRSAENIEHSDDQTENDHTELPRARAL